METKRESITRKEKVGEKQFIEWAKNKPEIKFEFTPDNCPYDIQMRSGSTLIIAEIKIRTYTNDYFLRYGPFLEWKKITGIFNKKRNFERRENNPISPEMMYFNFTKDGLMIYSLKNPWEYSFKEKLLPKDDFNPKDLEWKDVAELYSPIEIYQ